MDFPEKSIQTHTIERSQIIICFVSLKNNGVTTLQTGMLSNDIWIFLYGMLSNDIWNKTHPPTEMQIKVDSRLLILNAM